MKRKLFTILAMILCVCFCFAGCSLFPENTNNKNNQIVIEAGDVEINREEFVSAYNRYYSTFYNQYQDSDKALNALVDYLVSKELYLEDANNLLDEEKIVLTKTEQNYLWQQTLNAIITNIESFEEKVKDSLNNSNDDVEEDEEKEQETQFVYTPYDKKAEIVYNEETQEYEIVVIKEVLTVKSGENGDEYEYVLPSEAENYDDSNLELHTIQYVYDRVEIEKLFSNKTELTAEEVEAKTITMEALRRYVAQLEKNEEGKNLSSDKEEVFEREVERIYDILKENILITKLYEYKSGSITVSEDELLKYYLEKVQACYDRYFKDSEVFIEELTKTVGSANQMGSYGTPSNCVEDVFYIPNEISEKFFYVTHIVINLTETQIERINKLKSDSESNGYSEEEYNEQLYKIIPDINDEVISKVIKLIIQLENEEITQEKYDEELLKVIGSKLLMVDERDSEGYVSKEVKTVQEMIASLYKDLDEINIKYYGEANVSKTLNGIEYKPTENGLITAEKNGNNNQEVINELTIKYQNERADKFNEYIYKYSQDGGTIQIQKSYFGDTFENWYLYAMGDGETDNDFMESFVETSRDLHESGEITSYKTFLMMNWKESSGIETLQKQSTAFSTMMYCGQINNLFECFDEAKFTLNDLLTEEKDNGKAKYHSLLKMDQLRLGLTMNKTLFDLMFEEYYDVMYNEVIGEYEDEIIEDLTIKLNKEAIKDLIG